jgi:hypothetical protein
MGKRHIFSTHNSVHDLRVTAHTNQPVKMTGLALYWLPFCIRKRFWQIDIICDKILPGNFIENLLFPPWHEPSTIPSKNGRIWFNILISVNGANYYLVVMTAHFLYLLSSSL